MASSGARHRSAGVLAHSARSKVGFIGWYSLRHHKDSARSPAHTHVIRALGRGVPEQPPKACFQSTKRTLCCTRRPVRLARIYFICTVLALQSPIVSRYALLLHRLYVQTAEGTQHAPQAPAPCPQPSLMDGRPMTPEAFSASLERSAAKHPPSKARRIAALLPQIEAAMACMFQTRPAR